MLLKVMLTLLLLYAATLAQTTKSTMDGTPQSESTNLESGVSQHIGSIDGDADAESAPRVLLTKAAKTPKASHKPKARKAKSKKRSHKKLAYKIEDGVNLNNAVLKIKEAHEELKEKKKFKTDKFQYYLKNLQLDPGTFEILSEATNKEEVQKVRKLKKTIEQTSPQLFKLNEDPNYKKYLKKSKKYLEKDIKAEINGYKAWRKKSWEKIESVWKQKRSYYIGDDKLNREEHEKLFQLFLIEDAEKLKFLLPFLDAQNKIAEIIERGLIELDNEKYIKLAVKIMSKTLFLEYLKRFKKYHSKHMSDYADDIKKIDAKYMKAFDQNKELLKILDQTGS